ncbi:Uncharacterised protein [Streptococcus gordonii]|nr:Uncharacterised protein [Streptococcus gordonii]
MSDYMTILEMVGQIFRDMQESALPTLIAI